MVDFGNFVYLDPQKTGSTFIQHFLMRHFNCDQLKVSKHGRINSNHKENTFYFISVRDPLDQYCSLYRYGCDQKGGLYDHLVSKGMDWMYLKSSPDFDAWLSFILDPKHAEFLGEDYANSKPDLFGFQSFRFLALSLQFPIQRLSALSTFNQLSALYDQSRIHEFVIRNERLVEDITLLLQTRLFPYVKDLDLALADLQGASRLNVSSPIAGVGGEFLSPSTLLLLRQREKFLFERFYPDSLNLLNDSIHP